MSAFGNSNYDPLTGTGDSSATVARVGNYQLTATKLNNQALIVTDTNDTESGFIFDGVSLREAVNYANRRPGDDTITFDPSLNGQTILVTEGELEVGGDSLTIEGLGADDLTVQELPHRGCSASIPH